MAGGLEDFRTILPSQQRRQLEKNLRRQCDEYYDEQREEWHGDPVYTAEEANRVANARHRYRLFTFSNFLTPTANIESYKANFADILADAHAGSVLLMIGGKGGCYPAVHRDVEELAIANGFRRLDYATNVAATTEVKLHLRLDEEVRWFDGHLKQLAGDLPPTEPVAAKLRKELDDDRLIPFGSSSVHAFRK